MKSRTKIKCTKYYRCKLSLLLVRQSFVIPMLEVWERTEWKCMQRQAKSWASFPQRSTIILIYVTFLRLLSIRLVLLSLLIIPRVFFHAFHEDEFLRALLLNIRLIGYLLLKFEFWEQVLLFKDHKIVKFLGVGPLKILNVLCQYVEVLGFQRIYCLIYSQVMIILPQILMHLNTLIDHVILPSLHAFEESIHISRRCELFRQVGSRCFLSRRVLAHRSLRLWAKEFRHILLQRQFDIIRISLKGCLRRVVHFTLPQNIVLPLGFFD